MNEGRYEVVVVGAGLAYLGVLSWAIANLSYDIWGGLVLAPVYALIGTVAIRRMFRDSLKPVATAMYWALLLKFGGAAARYWVGFEAYGRIDAGRYHLYASEAAGKVWSGEASVFTLAPGGFGTEFLERFTALTYAVTGTSQFGAFVTFSFIAFIGTLFFLKAAIVAVPSLAGRRYAWMLALFPSIVYWPSSIGKEALMMFGLGLSSYGLAVVLTRGRWLSSTLLIASGLTFAAFVRPHIAGIWVAAAMPALVVSILRRDPGTGRSPRHVNRFGIGLVLVAATAGLIAIAGTTVRYLAPGSDEESTTDTLTSILEETTRRTEQAGSSFTPPSVSNPLNWPYASIRTLTRPLPMEVQGVAQLISAAEMSVLLGIFVLSRRRLRNLPRLVISNPYVTFAVGALFLAGLAYTSLANLGVLTRQKSLIFPFLLLLPCLPEHRPRSRAAATREDALSIERAPEGDVPTPQRPAIESGAALAPPNGQRRVEVGPPRTGSLEKLRSDDDLWRWD